MPVRAVMSTREDAVLFNEALELLEAYGVPKGLLMPLENVEDGGGVKANVEDGGGVKANVEDGGGVKATGVIWLKQKAKVKHHFKRADSFLSYETKIYWQLEKNKMKNIKGVKMGIKVVKGKKQHKPFCFAVSEIVVNEKTTPPQIYFKNNDNLVVGYFPAEYFKNKD